MTRHIIPVPDWCVVTQTYDEHVARAKANGWCYRPGQQCSTYYYGGVDYAPPWARVQEPVNIRASADGVIERVSTDTTGYGKHIRLITGDNELTIYAHLSAWYVKVGEHVVQHQVIGLMGNTGNSTGKHLHWEIRIGGIPVDPLSMIGEDEPETETPFTMPETWPQPNQFMIVGEALAIRPQAGAHGTVYKRLASGTVVDGLEMQTVGSDIWIRIGNEQWVAALYGGEVMSRWMTK